MIREAVPFTSDRLLFRELVEEDAEALAVIYADPEVMRYIGRGDTKNPEATRREIAWSQERYDAAGYGLWATCWRETGELIGRCGLLDWELEGRQELEVGYLLARPWWGRGLGQEAARAVRDWARAQLGTSDLISLMYPDNARSIRVAEANGMRHEKNVTLMESAVCLYRLPA